MIKSNMIRLCIIIALSLSMLCGCGSNKGSDNDTKQSPPVEATKNEDINNETKNNIDSTPANIDSTSTQDNHAVNPENTENPVSSATNTPIASDNTPVEVKSEGNIQLVADKYTAAKGEIIKVELTVKDVPNLAAYQVNIEYDPSVLQAVDPDTGTPLANDTQPKDGNILVNSKYGTIPINNHNVEKGILNFGKTYINFNMYKSDGAPENTGVLAVVGFKVLEEKSTFISFKDSDAMLGSFFGTFLFDWDGNKLTEYTVAQPVRIN
ncbi:MAG TPA: cohesin domain-containing protein [Acetivibrio sp.]|jgi:hypothetical protein|nr:hypothetical protein [Clostridium sp.]HOQ01671.1 cohesin domain-containing protein [Acetivibrio clariflavus]HQA58005.1 cohesin domain-containing protein [Acetivibrio sp.]